MPHLNWKESALKQNVSGDDASGARMRLDLSFDSAHRDQLLPKLREVLAPEALASAANAAPWQQATAAELRVDLPSNWILFWKLREGESRLLIAHPQAGEWVATAALNADHAALFLERLASLKAGETLKVHELQGVARVSNVEITLNLTTGA